LAGEERKAFQYLKSIHLEDIRNQRLFALLLRLHAIAAPDEILWLSDDDMATALTDFPRTGRRSTKQEEGLQKIRLKILAILATFKPQNNFFVKPQTVSSNASTHCQCELAMLAKLIAAYEESGYVFPRRLVLVEDSAGVNKSNTRMRFLSLLVHLKVFDEIILVYFTVGAALDTHECGVCAHLACEPRGVGHGAGLPGVWQPQEYDCRAICSSISPMSCGGW